MDIFELPVFSSSILIGYTLLWLDPGTYLTIRHYILEESEALYT